MKNLKVTLALGLLTAAFSANAQQLGQYSQYLNNQFIINPAAAGEHEYLDVDLSFRQQWVGFDNAPQNYYLSAHTQIGGKPQAISNPSLRMSHPDEAITSASRSSTSRIKHGIGGIIASDNYGPFKRLNVSFAYAAHIPLGEKINWAVGANAGLANMNFDQNQISLATSSDATFDAFTATNQSINFLDVNIGTFLYSDKFFFGYSSNQLLQNSIYFGGNPVGGKLNVHHFFSGGVNFDVSEKLVFTPGFLAKYMNPAPLTFDLTAKLTFDKKYFGGLSYRHGDAIIVLLGACINNKIKFGYTYDYTLSGLSDHNSGGHEILLGIMLNTAE
jgi:type IX secretion system PorP/SprF family membrane protein